MKKTVFPFMFMMSLWGCVASFSVWALDPVAPRSERALGVIYVETPNPDDEITLVLQQDEIHQSRISTKQDVKVPVGDYKVLVKMRPHYTYEQAVTVRPTERHEIIVPGFGNLRVNGACREVKVYQEGKEIAKMTCDKTRTLPRGAYDVKIVQGKYNIEKRVDVVTNHLLELDIK